MKELERKSPPIRYLSSVCTNSLEKCIDAFRPFLSHLEIYLSRVKKLSISNIHQHLYNFTISRNFLRELLLVAVGIYLFVCLLCWLLLIIIIIIIIYDFPLLIFPIDNRTKRAHTHHILIIIHTRISLSMFIYL